MLNFPQLSLQFIRNFPGNFPNLQTRFKIFSQILPTFLKSSLKLSQSKKEGRENDAPALKFIIFQFSSSGLGLILALAVPSHIFSPGISQSPPALKSPTFLEHTTSTIFFTNLSNSSYKNWNPTTATGASKTEPFLFSLIKMAWLAVTINWSRLSSSKKKKKSGCTCNHRRYILLRDMDW